MIVPPSEELKVYLGVVSLVRVVTAVISASIGAIVSVFEVLSVSELEVLSVSELEKVKESSFLPHEAILRLTK